MWNVKPTRIPINHTTVQIMSTHLNPRYSFPFFQFFLYEKGARPNALETWYRGLTAE
jgi:hypothetical protein